MPLISNGPTAASTYVEKPGLGSPGVNRKQWQGLMSDNTAIGFGEKEREFVEARVFMQDFRGADKNLLVEV